MLQNARKWPYRAPGVHPPRRAATGAQATGRRLKCYRMRGFKVGFKVGFELSKEAAAKQIVYEEISFESLNQQQEGAWVDIIANVIKVKKDAGSPKLPKKVIVLEANLIAPSAPPPASSKITRRSPPERIWKSGKSALTSTEPPTWS